MRSSRDSSLPDGGRQLLLATSAREISASRRAIDVCVVMVVAPVAVVVTLVLIVLIRLDSPGPVFYRHRRVGGGGRPLAVLKLRTMVSNAESLRPQLEDRNSLSWPDFKIEADPRVTRAGRWLRATSLDELPQLWHVLRGEMTLVGPRAASIDVSKYELWQTERLEYRPGLFGTWQAVGRATVAFPDRCRMDIRDRRKQSMLTDLVLAFSSILAVLGRRGRH